MSEVEKMLKEMEQILDQLVQNAVQLQDISIRIIAQEELQLLQQRQEELISKLIEIDKAFYKKYPTESKSYQSETRNKITQKLEKFQELNTHFIENMSMHHGLIQFEISKRKKTS